QGERCHLLDPSVDLDTHISDVVNTLTMEDLRDVVLVGHSYAGLVITGAAERAFDRLARLVYLDALVPDDGQSGFDLNSPRFREGWEREAAEQGDGYKIAPRIGSSGDLDPVEAAWVRARLCPFPIATMRQPVAVSAAVKALPSTYIRCSRSTFAETARRCRAAGWPVLELDCGHNAMMTRPRELTELLLADDPGRRMLGGRA
ncbi:MAG: alpha/beta hydrolase, partial [Alphaproteobacteria bacterium]|nr:alpha/beta hydrolase [Alphaproteobacteria bacterium]